jgi:hypothetical protein
MRASKNAHEHANKQLSEGLRWPQAVEGDHVYKLQQHDHEKGLNQEEWGDAEATVLEPIGDGEDLVGP